MPLSSTSSERDSVCDTMHLNELYCCHYLSLQAHKLYQSDVYHFSVITRQLDGVHSEPSMLIFPIKNRIIMETEYGAFLSGLFYKNSIHVAVDVVVIQLQASFFPFISLHASKWKVFIKEVYHQLQIRQMGNRHR